MAIGDDNDKPSQPYTQAAKDRLAQISHHITPSPVKPRRRKSNNKSKPDLPADYSDILSQLSSLRTLASTPNNNHTGYQRQKAAGKLWVRERVEQLLDKDSLREIGSVSGTVTWGEVKDEQGVWDGIKEEPVAFVPSNSVQGFGLLGGRKILFTADDYSLRAGHADGSIAAKTVRCEFTRPEINVGLVRYEKLTR